MSDDDLVQSVPADDADTALAMSRRMLLAGDGALAEAWLVHAMRLGGVDMMWRAVDLLAELAPHATRWQGSLSRGACILSYPRVDLPEIFVSPDLFVRLDPEGLATLPAYTTLLVQSRDSDRARSALREASGALESGGFGVTEIGDHASGPVMRLEHVEASRNDVMRTAIDATLDALDRAGVVAAYLRPIDGQDFAPSALEQNPPRMPASIADARDEVLGGGPGDAAFDVGRWYDSRRLFRHAGAWFKHAAATGSFDNYSKITDHYCLDTRNTDGLEAQSWWVRTSELSYPRIDCPGIRVSKRLFAPIMLDGTVGHGMNMFVHVKTPQIELAVAALQAATPRLGLTAVDGREYQDSAQLDASDDVYTPNWISDVEIKDAGASLVLDCKDWMAPAMARTMIRIIVEELQTAGVEDAFLTDAVD